ncbi:unnamed protein product [Clavelina lepadiformis]|uniref:Uncharacterized protein n=1 Tax=Clavelina lepadiformis TaxID=159417 RepID=A0ABP0G503_CLALP
MVNRNLVSTLRLISDTEWIEDVYEHCCNVSWREAVTGWRSTGPYSACLPKNCGRKCRIKQSNNDDSRHGKCPLPFQWEDVARLSSNATKPAFIPKPTLQPTRGAKPVESRDRHKLKTLSVIHFNEVSSTSAPVKEELPVCCDNNEQGSGENKKLSLPYINVKEKKTESFQPHKELRKIVYKEATGLNNCKLRATHTDYFSQKLRSVSQQNSSRSQTPLASTVQRPTKIGLHDEVGGHPKKGKFEKKLPAVAEKGMYSNNVNKCSNTFKDSLHFHLRKKETNLPKIVLKTAGNVKIRCDIQSVMSSVCKGNLLPSKPEPFWTPFRYQSAARALKKNKYENAANSPSHFSVSSEKSRQHLWQNSDETLYRLESEKKISPLLPPVLRLGATWPEVNEKRRLKLSKKPSSNMTAITHGASKVGFNSNSINKLERSRMNLPLVVYNKLPR